VDCDFRKRVLSLPAFACLKLGGVMRWLVSTALGSALAVALAYGSHGASPFDLTVTARAEAGLDPATREFIATLPDTWRPQIARIVEDTMSRVDASFKEYVQQVDKLISDKVIEVQCHAVATSDQIVDSIVKRFPWVSQAGPMEKLREQVVTTDARRHSDSSPTFIKDIYNDLMIAAAYVSCQSASVLTAKADAKRILDDYRVRWLAWNRVESLKCTSSIDCLPIYKTTVSKVIDNSEERDLTASKVRVTFQGLDLPKQGKWPFASEIEFNKIEAIAMQLYEIENAIGGAKAVREAKAIDALNRAKQRIQEAKNRIDQQRKALDTVFRGLAIKITCEDLGRSYMPPLKDSLTEAIQGLNDATTMADLVKQEADSQLLTANTQLKRTTDVMQFCKPI
jgi:hypothetical protein